MRECIVCALCDDAAPALGHATSSRRRFSGNEQKVRCDARAKKIQRPNPCPSETGAQFRRSACAVSLGQGFTRTESRSPLPVQIPTRPPEKKMRPASPSVTPPSSATALTPLSTASLAGRPSPSDSVSTTRPSQVPVTHPFSPLLLPEVGRSTTLDGLSQRYRWAFER